MKKWKFDSSIIPHAGWELVVMRLGFAVLLFLVLPQTLTLSAQPHPVGLAHWLDLTFLSTPGIWPVIRSLTLIALGFYVVGVSSWIALTWLVLVTVTVGTLENSQGAINHLSQPFALIVGLQWLVLSVRLFRRPSAQAFWGPADLATQRLLMQYLKIAFVACYVTSAITKIDRTDGKWIWMTPNLAVQVAKTNADYYYTTGQPPDAVSEALPELMEHHPLLTRLLVGPALLLELFAFLALIGRLPALLMGLALIAMHQGIATLMELHFEIWQCLLLFVFVNPLYWLQQSWLHRRRRS